MLRRGFVFVFLVACSSFGAQPSGSTDAPDASPSDGAVDAPIISDAGAQVVMKEIVPNLTAPPKGIAASGQHVLITQVDAVRRFDRSSVGTNEIGGWVTIGSEQPLGPITFSDSQSALFGTDAHLRRCSVSVPACAMMDSETKFMGKPDVFAAISVAFVSAKDKGDIVGCPLSGNCGAPLKPAVPPLALAMSAKLVFIGEPLAIQSMTLQEPDYHATNPAAFAAEGATAMTQSATDVFWIDPVGNIRSCSNALPACAGPRTIAPLRTGRDRARVL